MLIRRTSIPMDGAYHPLTKQIENFRNYYRDLYPYEPLMDYPLPSEIPDAGRLVIDKIAFHLAPHFLNEDVAKLLIYRKPVHFLKFGKDWFQIVIHPDWMPQESIHAYRVLYGLLEMGAQGALARGYHAACRLMALVTGGRSSEDIGIIINFLRKTMVFSDWETAMDFYNFPGVEIPGALTFLHKENSYYSRKDYRKIYRMVRKPKKDVSGEDNYELKGVQYSFVKVYDWTSKHGGPRKIQRLEFRFQGRYTDYIDFAWLGLSTSGILLHQIPILKKLMWKVTLPTELRFSGFALMRRCWWLSGLITGTDWMDYRKELALVKKRIRNKKNAQKRGGVK